MLTIWMNKKKKMMLMLIMMVMMVMMMMVMMMVVVMMMINLYKAFKKKTSLKKYCSSKPCHYITDFNDYILF